MALARLARLPYLTAEISIAELECWTCRFRPNFLF
jgi:hypothetical protein